ncbi:MAG: hypothetical protein WDO74_08770 [Pseudomonadota bacterium]
MKSVRSLFVGSLVLALVAGGCGDSDHTGAGNTEDLSQLTPAELCKQKCDLQVAANCPKTPADYASSCALLCQAKYDKFPSLHGCFALLGCMCHSAPELWLRSGGHQREAGGRLCF